MNRLNLPKRCPGEVDHGDCECPNDAGPSCGENFPVITVCGSMQFANDMQTAAQQLSREGWIVLMPFVTFTGEQEQSTDDKLMLDRMHLAKISLSQAIYIVNPGGYIGLSTTREIRFAIAHERAIHSIEPIRFVAIGSHDA